MPTRFRDTPIQRKLMLVILLTSVVVMLLMRGAFITYEFVRFRETTLRQLSTLGEITATNSTAALAFDNPSDAKEILSALKAERHIAAAALYKADGSLFARYPDSLIEDALPPAPEADGYRFSGPYLAGFQPVVERGRRLGSLYLKFDTGVVMREWFWGSARIGLVVMAVVLLIAYGLSRVLQKRISHPILALTDSARAISVRAVKLGDDELGRLTDAFNLMLGEIQRLNGDLERRVIERTAQLEAANADLLHSRAELKSLFESIDEGYCIVEMLFDERDHPVDYRFLSINPAFEKQTGLVGAQGRRMLELAPTHEAHWFEIYGRIAVTGEPERFQNYARALHRWFDVYAFRFGDPAKRQVAIIFSDITERKRGEDQIQSLNADLRQHSSQLEAANKELEAFSYSVSHDLRAPLRHIHGFSSLLEKDATTLTPDGRRHLGVIRGAAKQMGRLIDDLLAFSRTSRMPLSPTEISSDALVAGVIRDGRYEADGRTVAWDIGPLPPARADAAMLQQVWVNLIDNAVKYSAKAAQPRVVIRGAVDAAAGESVFSVADNGVGFDMAYAGKLFGVFQRLHGPAEFEGTGIGLANVRRIVMRHGGRTWAEGRVGQGATFFFSLPAPHKTNPAPAAHVQTGAPASITIEAPLVSSSATPTTSV